MGIDSENYHFGKLKPDHSQDFPNLTDRSNVNRRRKLRGDYIARLNQHISRLINKGENVYSLDSIPIRVGQIVKEKSRKFERKLLNSNVKLAGR